MSSSQAVSMQPCSSTTIILGFHSTSGCPIFWPLAGIISIQHTLITWPLASEWTLICHTTMCRNFINFPYNPDHMILWCLEVVRVANAREIHTIVDVTSYHKKALVDLGSLEHGPLYSVLENKMATRITIVMVCECISNINYCDIQKVGRSSLTSPALLYDIYYSGAI